MKKVSFDKIFIILLLAIFVMSAITLSTTAYFKFRKVFDGNGNLPILNIDYKINTGDIDSLKNIVYNGQVDEQISVALTTSGNNVSGKVRAKVGISWSNSLNNTPYNNNNEIVTACEIVYQTSLWEQRNGFFYLKSLMEKDGEIELFSSIKFGEALPDEYRGENVSIYLILEIYQDYNLPANW